MSVELTIVILLVIGLAFMALEAFVPSFGLLGIGGAASFYAALVMLHHVGSIYGIPVETPTLIALGLIAGAVLGASFYYVRVARKSKITAGAEMLPGMTAKVLNWSGTSGQVHVDGEAWAATGPEGLVAGDLVTVQSRHNLVLTVSKGMNFS